MVSIHVPRDRPDSFRWSQIYLTTALLCLCLPALSDDPPDWQASGTTGWSIYFPVHMPALELTVPEENGEELDISADMPDLAKHANSFFALGLRYDFGVFNHGLWLDINGWHGAYDLDEGDLTAKLKPPRPDRDLLNVTFDMEQRIVQAEGGLWLVKDWNKLDLGLFTGTRYYDQEIKVSGDVATLARECRPGACLGRESFKQEDNLSWAEAILGLTAVYKWHESNALAASVSYGHEGSSRIQLINTWTFSYSWFGSLGWRRDAFESDGVDVVENGAYFDVGKRF